MSHECPECEREFKTPLGLAIHFGRMHKGKIPPPVQLDPREYPFLCSICEERRFKSKRGLSTHLSRTHGVKIGPQRQAEAMRRRKILERRDQPHLYPHKCSLCEFRGISQMGLSTHVTKMHPGHIYFKRPTRVGFGDRSDRPPKRHSTQYDEETLEWIERRSDKNLLVRYMSSDVRVDRAIVPCLKRNKIITSNLRWKKGDGSELTNYGKELLLELQGEQKK